MRIQLSETFPKITEPKKIAELLKSALACEHRFDQAKEHFWAIGVNTKHVVQYLDMVSLGTLDASLVHPRESFRMAVSEGV